MEVLAFLAKKYKSKTAKSYYKEWEYFKAFILQLQIEVSAVTYLTILAYVSSLKEKGLGAKTVNRKLMIIELIFTHLELPKVNPVKGLRIKVAKEKPLAQPMDYTVLSEYLSVFSAKNAVESRNKVILSLIHYQALRLAEIKALKLEHIQLKSASLEVPSVLRSNSRTLALTALQIIYLQEYLSEYRTKLPNHKSSQLFISSGSSKSLANAMTSLQASVCRALPKLQNLGHWRTSVIVYWLESQSILSVQQKLGHRYASSTERYKVHSIKSLQEDLKLYHPLS